MPTESSDSAPGSVPGAFALWPGMCREPVHGPAGFGSASRPVPHNWRLLERQKTFGEFDYTMQEGAPGFGTVKMVHTGWIETWYCTRCRTVEEREVSK